jgi:hypothetical protein
VTDAITPDGYYLANETGLLRFTYVREDADPGRILPGPVATNQIVIRGVFGTGVAPDRVTVRLVYGPGGTDVVTVTGNDGKTPAQLQINPRGEYTIDAAMLARVARDVFAQRFGDAKFSKAFDPATVMPLSGFLRVTPVVAAPQAGVEQGVVGTLRIETIPKP